MKRNSQNEIMPELKNNIGNKMTKKPPLGLFHYLLISFSGTLVNLLLLYLTLIVVIKMFSVNSREFFLIALGTTSLWVTFTQGIRGGSIIRLTPIIGGGIASLPLNILCIVYLFRGRVNSFLIFVFFAIVAANLIAATLGFQYGTRTCDSDHSEWQIYYLLSINSGLMLIPITLIVWSGIIILLRYAFGLI